MSRFLPAQQCQQTPDVVRQGSQALGYRPEPLQAQRIQGQAAERGHDPHAVALAVAVCVFPELGVAGPVPGVFDRPTVAYVLQQRFGTGPETRVEPIDALSQYLVGCNRHGPGC